MMIYLTYLFADETLQRPPAGFDSVLGVKQTSQQPSFFTENEYVVFDTERVMIKYVVEFLQVGESRDLGCGVLSLPRTADAGLPVLQHVLPGVYPNLL